MEVGGKKLSRQEVFSNSLEMLCYFDEFCKQHYIRYFLHAGTLLGAVRHQGFTPWDDDVDISMLRKDFQKLLDTFYDSEKYELQFFDRVNGYAFPYGKLRDRRTLQIDEITKKPYNPECGLDIDIFIIDGYPNSPIIRKIHFAIQNFLFKMYERTFIDLDNIKGYKKIVLQSYQLLFSKSLMAKIVNIFAGIWDISKAEYAGCMVGLYRHKIELAHASSFRNCQESKFEGKSFPVPIDTDDVLTSIYGENYMVPPPPEKRVSTHSSYQVWKG